MQKDSYVVKSIKIPPRDILGNLVAIQQGTNLSRINIKDGFIKIFSHGNAMFKDAKIYKK